MKRIGFIASVTALIALVIVVEFFIYDGFSSFSWKNALFGLFGGS